MFLDPFIFTPPRPDFLTRAVESYQRVAAARFCRYARDAEDPDLLHRKLSGLSLDPTPKQLHAEVRALRHLTAIQRTLRELGGPLFNPHSPIPPHERFRIVERRLEAIEEALGDPEDSFAGEFPATESVRHGIGGGENAGSTFFPLDLDSEEPFPSSERFGANRSPTGDGTDLYHPPEIEDLLEAVNFAQTVFAARAELLDKRRLTLSSEDFLLEIASLRDLTAIVRTLRRMSAHRLPEDEPLPKSFSASSLGATSACRRSAIASGEGASAGSAASAAADTCSPVGMPESAPSLDPSSYSSHRSYRSHDSQFDPHTRPSPALAGASPSEISNLESEIPNPPSSHSAGDPAPDSTLHPAHPARRSHSSCASSESVESVKSVDPSVSASAGPASAPPCTSAGLINSMKGDCPLRPVPRIPEIRPVTAPRPADTPTPIRETPCSSVPARDSAPASENPIPKSEIPGAAPSHAPPVLCDRDPPPGLSP